MRNSISILLIGFCVVAMSGVAWGQNYQTFDATTTNAWNTLKWSSSSATNACATLGTNAFTSGNIAYFCTASGTGNGPVGIQVGGIIATENYTHSSGSGTLTTGGTVVTVDVANGKTFDLGSGSSYSAASGTGFIKAGGGTWNIRAGSAYNGGFSLNAGTIIVSGSNSFGTSLLTIAGGTTIQSSGSSTFAPSSVTVNGDFTLSGTGSDIWGMPVALGSSTRTITNSTTSGSRTYSGIISGNPGVGLTFAGTGAGIMILSGANTYTGLTTVSSGTVQLNRSGGTTIPITNNVTVSGGTLRISSDQTVNDLTVASGATLTVDAGVTLTVNGTYSVSSSSSGNGGTITVNGTLQINQGGWPGNTGTFTYGASGILAFANSSGSYGVNSSDTWWPSSSGPANVTVSGAGGITMNVARTVSGTFIMGAPVVNAGNLLTFSGNVQINASNFDVSPIYSGNATLIYNTTYGPYVEWISGSSVGTGVPKNVTIQNSATVTMPTSTRTCIGNLTITSGTLALSTTFGADLNVGGNWSNSGTFTPNTRAVQFNGSTAQSITGATTFDYLTINNSSTGVSLNNDVTVNNTLTLTSGNITTDANTLKLGSSTSSVGTLTRTSGTVVGNFKRWIGTTTGTDILFPIGTAANYRPSTVNFSAISTGGTLTATFVSGWPGLAGLPLTETNPPDPLTLNLDRVGDAGVWRIDAADGLAGVTFSGSFETNGFQAFSDFGSLRIIRRPSGGGDWVRTGDPGVNASPAVKRINMTQFSEFGIGADNSMNPLPIQLSSFTGTLINNRVKLDWATISEVNNYGFYVQKRAVGVLEWWSIDGSFVAGHGTTNVPQYYTFTDNSAFTGATEYRLKQVDLDGSINFTDPIRVENPTSVKELAPIEFALKQNYPNPFNPSTEIKFSVAAYGHTSLRVYDMLGREVATLFNEVAEPGHYYKVQFDASNFASGMYMYRLQSGKKNDLKKLIFLK